MKEILDVIHKTIYQFFDVCGDDEEVPISDKDKLLLEVNKAICNNLKALEQEPCEDAVSRQEVKEQMLKYGFYGPDMTVTEFVEDLPPVTPQPKMGQWINGECSICGEHAPYWILATTYYNSKYCPNCGYRMHD